MLMREFLQKLTVEESGHITRANKGSECKALRVMDSCCLTMSVAACAVADLVEGTLCSPRTIEEMDRCFPSDYALLKSICRMST